MAARASFSIAVISSGVRFRRTTEDFPFSCLVSASSSTSTDAVIRRTRPAGVRTWRIFLLTANVELSDLELWLSIAEKRLEMLGTAALDPPAGVMAEVLLGTLLAT